MLRKRRDERRVEEVKQDSPKKKKGKKFDFIEDSDLLESEDD
jgi:hypothetical protein